MSRLIVHVEGQTEKRFVDVVLRPHLFTAGYHSVSTKPIGDSRRRTGGICSWASARTDILNHLKEDPNRVSTTLLDFYGMPKTAGKGWPGRTEADGCEFAQGKAKIVQDAVEAEIRHSLGDRHFPLRFVPFVLMHEFEALLFSDCTAFSNAIGRPDLRKHLQEICDRFDGPESINDSPETAPSKRIAQLLPSYNKPSVGAIAILEIGLPAIRVACPNFHAWLTRLEALAQNPHIAPTAATPLS